MTGGTPSGTCRILAQLRHPLPRRLPLTKTAGATATGKGAADNPCTPACA